MILVITNLLSSMNDSDHSYGFQDDKTTFNEAEIDYTIDVHSNHMGAVMHIIYADLSHAPFDTQSSLNIYLISDPS